MEGGEREDRQTLNPEPGTLNPAGGDSTGFWNLLPVMTPDTAFTTEIRFTNNFNKNQY
jgi:hypothetical protein